MEAEEIVNEEHMLLVHAFFLGSSYQKKKKKRKYIPHYKSDQGVINTNQNMEGRYLKYFKMLVYTVFGS